MSRKASRRAKAPSKQAGSDAVIAAWFQNLPFARVGLQLELDRNKRDRADLLQRFSPLPACLRDLHDALSAYISALERGIELIDLVSAYFKANGRWPDSYPGLALEAYAAFQDAGERLVRAWGSLERQVFSYVGNA